jgi:hypothetical protein
VIGTGWGGIDEGELHTAQPGQDYKKLYGPALPRLTVLVFLNRNGRFRTARPPSLSAMISKGFIDANDRLLVIAVTACSCSAFCVRALQLTILAFQLLQSLALVGG